MRIFLDNRARPDRRRLVSEIIDDIRRKIDHIDIAITENRDDANVLVMLIRERDFAKDPAQLLRQTAGRKIEHSLEPQCLTGLAKKILLFGLSVQKFF